MSFEVRPVQVARDRAAVFALAGELDLATVDVVRVAAEPACAKGDQVVLDMSDVAFCDSTGLGLIINLYRQATGAGGSVTLCALQERIRFLLEISGVDQVVPVAATVDEALRQGGSATDSVVGPPLGGGPDGSTPPGV
jgi:anti-sigma B factor antagonist